MPLTADGMGYLTTGCSKLSCNKFAEMSRELTQAEIAHTLGIGRARVFYQEQSAIKKLRDAFARQGIKSLSDFYNLDFKSLPEGFVNELANSIRPRSSKESQLSPLHGWLKASQILSLNKGKTEPREITCAFNLLKQDHPAEVAPPVFAFMNDEAGVASYRVEALAERDDKCYFRCWPIGNNTRSVKHLSGCCSTLIVESEFGEDENGQFEIPILLCGLLSSRPAEAIPKFVEAAFASV